MIKQERIEEKISFIIDEYLVDVHSKEREEVTYLIKVLMRLASVATLEKVEDFISKLYPSMNREKKERISNMPLPLDLNVLDVPESMKDPRQILIELMKENPKTQNSVISLQKELKKKGIKIVRA
jgi:hypothetical protein